MHFVDFEQIDIVLNNISDICSCSNPVTIGAKGQTVDWSDNLLSSPVTNKCFKIYGELRIDEFAHFIDCKFIMDEGALITIEEDEVLDISGSHLQSCTDYLWQGIKMERNSEFLLKNSTFRHSYFGIHSEDQSVSAEITNNIFDNNFQCINIGDLTHSGKLTTLTMTGNLFAQTEWNLGKDIWEGGPLIFQFYTDAVITRNARVYANASYNAVNDRNIVYQYFNGYRFLNSFAVVKSNLMKDFRKYGSEHPEYGWGINNQGVDENGSVWGNVKTGILLQEGWVNMLNHSFENVYLAIAANDSDLSISKNSIVGSYEGIGIRKATMVNDVSIMNNIIESTLAGISILEQPANELKIWNNKIYIDHDAHFSAPGLNIVPFGLFINNTQPSSSILSNGSIYCNLINATSSNFGMRFVNPGLRQVTYSEINMNGEPFDFSAGIQVEGGRRNFINSSAITTTHPSSRTHETFGLKMIGSRNNGVGFLHTRGSDYGFYFASNNRMTNMRQNIFQNHDIGYYIEPAALTGDQSYVGNQWIGSFHTWDALNEGPLVGNLIFEYTNHDNPPVNFEPDPGWIEFFDTGSYFPTFSSICTLETSPPTKYKLDDIDYEIADDNYTNDEFPDRKRWSLEKDLYDELRADPDLLTEDSLFIQFWNDHQNTSISQFSDVWHDLGDILTKTPEWQDSIDLSKDELVSLLIYADSLSIDMKNNPTDNELRDYFYSLQLDLDTLTVIYRDIVSSWLSGVKNEMENLIPAIDQLPTPNLYAANEKLVLGALARYYIHPDSIGATLLSDIVALSEKCIHENGPAVIHAGALRTNITGDKTNFDTYCPDPSGSRFVEVPDQEESAWILFPNPATDEVSIVVDQPISHSGEVRIYNLEGKLMLHQKMNKGDESISLSTSGLSSGYYFVQFNDGKSVEVKPLVIK